MRWTTAASVSATRHASRRAWQIARASEPRSRSVRPAIRGAGPITDVPDYGKTFLDSYRPALLDEGLDDADGQMLEEDYEVRQLHPEQDVPGRRDVLGLPQRPQPEAARHGQQRVPALPPAAELRHRRPPPPQAGDRRGAVPELPHALDDVHGRRSPPRPLDARAASGLLDQVRHSERVHHAVSRGQEPRVGERRRREVVCTNLRGGGNDYVSALAAARRHEPWGGGASPLRAAVLNDQFPPIARATALKCPRQHS